MWFVADGVDQAALKFFDRIHKIFQDWQGFFAWSAGQKVIACLQDAYPVNPEKSCQSCPILSSFIQQPVKQVGGVWSVPCWWPEQLSQQTG